MVALVKDVEQENKFSTYPEQVDKYFLDREFIVRTFPQEMSQVAEFEFPDIRITSAKQFVDFLNEEIAYWKENDPNNRLQPIVQYNKLSNAKHQFDTAINNANNPYTIRSCLDSCRNDCSTGILLSKTRLAQLLLQYVDRSAGFFNGFKIGISNNKSASTPSNVDGWEGFYAALSYKGIYNQYITAINDTIQQLRNNAEITSKKYSELNQSYVNAFHEQESRITNITQQTNEHLNNMESEKQRFFESAKERVDNLEYLYGEKLKLSEPAQYWDNIDKEYRQKGTKWLIVSGLLALFIVGGLITFLLLAPTMFSDDYHWFDNLKNSAIITVVASIAIYMLRLTVKMATSSYHLSRDAKERNNLSYFYLALIEKDAVSDKERALILNSLFSRSDTGLLKGEAAPSMPTNVSDIVDFLKNN